MFGSPPLGICNFTFADFVLLGRVSLPPPELNMHKELISKSPGLIQASVSCGITPKANNSQVVLAQHNTEIHSVCGSVDPSTIEQGPSLVRDRTRKATAWVQVRAHSHGPDNRYFQGRLINPTAFFGSIKRVFQLPLTEWHDGR